MNARGKLGSHLLAAAIVTAAGAAAVFLHDVEVRRWFRPPTDSFAMGHWANVHPWWSTPAAAVTLAIGLLLAWFVVVGRFLAREVRRSSGS